MTEKVHLLDLRVRTSAAGNVYLSGWLGKAAVVGFRDRDAEDEVWNIYVSAPTPRPGDTARTTSKRQPRRPAWVDQAGADNLDDPVDDL